MGSLLPPLAPGDLLSSPRHGDALGLEIGLEAFFAEFATPARLLVTTEGHGGIERRMHVYADLSGVDLADHLHCDPKITCPDTAG